MRHLAILFIHCIAVLARLLGPGGVRSIVAESLLLKHELLIVSRSRQRSPNLSSWDRILARWMALHDDRTFAPLEKRVFTATPEQCFLQGYRSVCRELFVRRCRPGVIDVMRSMDEDKSPKAQAELHAFVSAFAHGSQSGMDDLEWHKTHYDKALADIIHEE